MVPYHRESRAIYIYIDMGLLSMIILAIHKTKILYIACNAHVYSHINVLHYYELFRFVQSVAADGRPQSEAWQCSISTET